MSSGAPLPQPIRGPIGGGNRGANPLDMLPAEQRKICDKLLINPHISSREMAKDLGIRRNTVLKQLEALKAKGILVREGDTRGFWKVKV